MEQAPLPMNWNERPDNFLGESTSSYLHEGPRRKVHASWIGGQKEAAREDAAICDNDGGVASQDCPSAERGTEETQTPNGNDAEASEKNTRQKVSSERENMAYMAERPDGWLVGGGEAVEILYHQNHKTKLISNWFENGSGSQSMRDLSVDMNGHDNILDLLNSSESHLFSAKGAPRRKSTMIAEKLDLLIKKNEENHKANEELTVEKKSKEAPLFLSAVAKAASIYETNKQRNKEKADQIRTFNSNKHKVKVHFLKEEGLHLLRRPETWLGGEAEKLEFSYLHKPKTKLKDSWLSGPGMSQSMRDLSSDDRQEDLNASDSHFFSARRRQTSPRVMEKLLDFQHQNEENHKRNEELAVEKSKAAAKAKEKVPVQRSKLKETEATSPDKDKSKTTIAVQREDLTHMMDRPISWMGGEGEAAEFSYLQKPKTKLRTSWLQNGGWSQNMRDLSADSEFPRDITDPLNSSESQLSLVQSRKPSTLIQEKLSGLAQWNEETHKKNEALAVTKASQNTKVQETKAAESKATDLQQSTPVSAGNEKVRLQRVDHNGLARRPDDWIGGEAASTSPRSPMKGKAVGHITSPILVQNPLVDAGEEEKRSS